jgi:hypothetical protein
MVVAPCLPILLGSTELIYGLRLTRELLGGACRDRTLQLSREDHIDDQHRYGGDHHSR